jgi:hypothetical protein
LLYTLRETVGCVEEDNLYSIVPVSCHSLLYTQRETVGCVEEDNSYSIVCSTRKDKLLALWEKVIYIPSPQFVVTQFANKRGLKKKVCSTRKEKL